MVIYQDFSKIIQLFFGQVGHTSVFAMIIVIYVSVDSVTRSVK